MDGYIYEKSSSSEMHMEDMIDKQVLYVQDTNGGNYNGQITIETSTLANSGKWLAYSESYLEIPFVVALQSLTSLTGVANTINPYMVGLKNGYHQLIDSIQIDCVNTNVVQLQSFTNFEISYRLMNEFSQSDVKKYGTKIGFMPDNASSGILNSIAAPQGDGFCNNTYSSSQFAAGSNNFHNVYEPINNGLFQRQLDNALDLSTGTNSGALTAGTGYGQMSTTGQAQAVGKNYFSDNGVAVQNRIYQWVIIATIRMKDVCDFMKQLPLLKGVYLRFIINYNSGYGTISPVVAGPSMTQTSWVQLSGRTNPLLVASSATNNPMNLAVLNGAAGLLTIGCGVKSCSNPVSTINPPITSCRLYVPAFTLNPSKESQYITMHGSKKIIYNDIYNYPVVNQIAAGTGSFSVILTNGIVNPKYVIIMPYFSAGIANTGFVTYTGSPYQSFFDTAPGTTSPACSIQNFNVQVSGQNMFQTNEQYDFQQFFDELSQNPDSINGGGGVGLQSGLLDAFQWEMGYRYYVCNVARRLPADDTVPKSIVITGQNNGLRAIDLICFVIFERSITINLVDGSIIKV